MTECQITFTIHNDWSSVNQSNGSRKIENLIKSCCTYTKPRYGRDPETKKIQYLYDQKKPLWEISASDNLLIPTGLISLILLALKSEEVICRLIDKRLHLPDNPLTFAGEFRDYQSEAVKVMKKATRGVLDHATNSGKTNTSAQFIAETGRTSLFIEHRVELLNQSKARFEELLPGQKIGIIGSGKEDIQLITIGMIQTIWSRRYTSTIREYLNQVECLIIDECHHARGNTYYRLVMGYVPNAFYKFGVSGTPQTKAGSDMILQAATGKIIHTVKQMELIRRKISSLPHISMITIYGMIPANQLYAMVEKGKNVYAVSYQSNIVNNSKRNKIIASLAIEAAAQKKSVLIIVTRVAHGKKLLKLLPEGIARYMHGKSLNEDREKALKEFAQGDFSILIGTVIYQEGIDVPRINVYINAAGGKSIIATVQKLGRALRVQEGKEEVEVIDFIDIDGPEEHARLKPGMLERHSLTRKQTYEKEGFNVKIQ